MGNSVATNVIDSIVNATLSIINSTTQSCEIVGSQIVNFTFTNIHGQVIVSHININQLMGINVDCMQSASTKNNMSAIVQQEATQVAKAITQAIGMGSANASNFTKQVTNLMMKIVNDFHQNCIPNLTQNVNFYFNNVGSVTFTYSTISQIQEIKVKCAQKSAADSDEAAQISQTVSQTAVAKEESLFAFLAVILLVLVGGVLVVGKGGMGTLTDPKKLLALIAIVIGGYLGLAYWRKWKPFHKTIPTGGNICNNPNPPAACSNPQ